jgi:hypothetical protein
MRRRGSRISASLRFVLMVGVMSFFADFTYEGSRSIIGQYLGLLGAGALAISMITGFGELLGYGLRLFSGRGADRTGWYWPITIGGYILQMSVVPLLALAGSWQVAAVLIILERVGKAIRNPPRDAMLSYAAKEMGYGWAFGVHEALDQFGAMFGPLLIALILAAGHHDYKTAFAVLAVPAAIMLSLLAVARLLYPRPEDLEAAPAQVTTHGLPRVFWIYLAGAALVGAGFADFPIIAYHFQKTATVHADLTPIFYAAAMAVSGTGSLVFGRLFDRYGIAILVPLTILSAAYAPLAFLGGSGPASLASAYGGWGWACTSRSSPPPWLRWSPPTDAPPPMACSPACTASPGLPAAPRSAPCSASRWAPSSRSRWSPNWSRSRSFSSSSGADADILIGAGGTAIAGCETTATGQRDDPGVHHRDRERRRRADRDRARGPSRRRQRHHRGGTGTEARRRRDGQQAGPDRRRGHAVQRAQLMAGACQLGHGQESRAVDRGEREPLIGAREQDEAEDRERHVERCVPSAREAGRQQGHGESGAIPHQPGCGLGIAENQQRERGLDRHRRQRQR